MHLDENRIERLLHGEMASEELGPTKDHLASCPACTALVEDARREEEELFGLLEQLDHPVPSLSLGQVSTPKRPTGPRRLRWAAGIIGVLGISTAAYAAPGSPVPVWIQRLTGHSPSEPTALTSPISPVGPSGIRVSPGAELVVVFGPAARTGSVRITIEPIDEVVVEARVGNPTFTADLTRLLVEPGDASGEFLVRIPNSAPLVEVRHGDQLLFAKVGPSVSADVPMDDQGGYTFPLGG